MGTTGGLTASEGLGAASLITSISGIFGAIQNASLNKTLAKTRADERRFTAQINARIAERNARIVQERVDFQVAQLEKQIPLETGAVRSAFGVANITGETAEQVEEAVQTAGIMRVIATKFEGFVDVQNELIRASSERIRAKNAKIGEKIDTAAANIELATGVTKGLGDFFNKAAVLNDKGLLNFLKKDKGK